MNLGLEGKVALVAAASRGLGRAVAAELVAEGASVAICARDAAELARTRDELQRQAKGEARVVALAADLSTSDGIARVTDGALEAFGRLDILVTNAGGPPTGTFEQHDWAAWQRAVDLTLRSAVELIRHVLPGMKERQWGRILNITSMTVKQPVPGLILSNSIRAAVTGMARTLADEVAPHGITVNNILPGYTRTDRVTHLNAATAQREGISVEEVAQRTARQIPMHRLGEPREFAAVAAFLVSERASYVTAQSIAVDGGWVRGLY